MNPFCIAPLLDKGVQFDPYADVLVAKIRAGRYTADLWDCNSLYLGYSERLASLRAPRPAFKSPYVMTPAQFEEYREARRAEWEARAAQRAQLAQERAAAEAQRKTERDRIEREWAERRARKEAEKEQRDREWAERSAEIAETPLGAEWERLGEMLTKPRFDEERAILMNKWQCRKCLGVAHIKPAGKSYLLTCVSCGSEAEGDHATLVKMLPEPRLCA